MIKKNYFGAGSRTRTGTVSPPQTPEACASTNSAIPALIIIGQELNKLVKSLTFFCQKESENGDEIHSGQHLDHCWQ